MGCGGSKKQDIADPSAVELDEPSVAQAVTETLEVKAQPAKAAEMMRLIPDVDVSIIDRCSGHGGSWGIKKENFETAIKVGKPAARQALSSNKKHIVSECPLAGMHLGQGLGRLADAKTPAYEIAPHPIILFGRAYGVAI